MEQARTLFRTAILTVLCGMVVMPASAPAAVGDLSFRDCVTSISATTGCTDVSGTTNSLGGLNEAVEFGAGGKDVYGIAEGGDAVVHLRRDTDTGALTFQDCVTGSPTPSTGCTDISATTQALDGANALVVPADGRDAYAASAAGALIHFTRDATTGTLTFADCMSSVAVSGCTNVSASTGALSSFESLGVGVGGSSVYAGTGTGSSMVHLTRDAAGKLTFQDCVSGSAVTGCTNIGGTTAALGSPPQGRFAISSDGQNIYAVNDAGALITFNLTANGAVTFAGCLTSSATAGCTSAGPTGALGQEAVAISADGRHVYSTGGSAISRLTRNTTTGALTFVDCITTGAGPVGCTNIDAVNDEFSAPQSLAVSGDGFGVYLVGAAQLVDLRRNPDTGQLTFSRCFTSGAAPVMGCTDITSTSSALEDLQAVAVSPSETKVYLASGSGAAMVSFERQLAPGCNNGSAHAAAPADVTIPLICSDPNGDAVTRSIVSPPAHGTLGPLNQTTGTVTYSPAPGYDGPDSFTFQANAAGDPSNVATETISVARDRLAPVVTSLSATPNTFRAARVTLHPKGTKFRYRLSEFAVVTLSVQRPAAGRRVRKKCVRPTKANRKKPRCTRWITIGKLTQLAGAGLNTRAFNGRLAGKKLAPGRYRVQALARDAAGNASQAKTVGFRVVSR